MEKGLPIFMAALSRGEVVMRSEPPGGMSEFSTDSSTIEVSLSTSFSKQLHPWVKKLPQLFVGFSSFFFGGPTLISLEVSLGARFGILN